MGKTEIVILIVTILVSVFLLSIFLTKTLKQKPKKAKENKVEEKVIEEKIEKSEPVKEQVKEKQLEEKKVQNVSIALQNELDEFKDYLKSRVTKAPNDDSIALHPYDTPKLNRSFDDFPQDFFDSDFSPPPYRRSQKNEDLENLPNKIKALLLTDFFDTKF